MATSLVVSYERRGAATAEDGQLAVPLQQWLILDQIRRRALGQLCIGFRPVIRARLPRYMLLLRRIGWAQNGTTPRL